MKLKSGDVDRFVAKPDPRIRAVVVYGPDAGGVRERADRLSKTIVDDLNDPFRVAELAPATLREDPARLADEAQAMAFGGGSRVVRVRGAGEETAKALEGFLENPMGDALIVIEAGDLSAKSSLRKMAESSDTAAAMPCYADDSRNLGQVISETLEAAGLRAEREAMAYLMDHLGADRMLSRAELEKLILYKGEPGSVTLADVEAVIGDSSAIELDELIYATAEGNQAVLDPLLERVYSEGQSPVAVIRAAQRHFQRLHLCAGMVRAGRQADDAMSALKPRVFWKYQKRFSGQLRRWPLAKVNRAMEILLEAEVATKTTGAPDAAICARALMRIAQAGRRG